MDKQAAWHYAWDLINIEELNPSEDFEELIKKEISGQRTLEELLQYLDRKYGKAK